jgi:hypothetical protein
MHVLRPAAAWAREEVHHCRHVTACLALVARDLAVGPCANHVAFVGKFAYVTVGGQPPCAPGGVDREGKIVVVDRTTRQIVEPAPAPGTTQPWNTGPAWTGDPHGIWATPLPLGTPPPAGPLLYVGHERPNGGGNRVTVLDTGDANNPNDDRVIATIADPTYMKQPIDVVIKR